MDLENEFIEKYAERMLGEFSKDALSELRVALTKQKLISSNELYNRLRYDIIKATAQSAASAGISFPDYGRFKDMRGVKYTKPLPGKAIQEEIIPWVRRRGVNSFKYIPGYPKGATIPTEETAIKRIAWGIGKGIHLGNKKYRSKRWYNKILWGKINEFTEKVNYNYTEFAKTKLKDALNDLT